MGTRTTTAHLGLLLLALVACALALVAAAAPAAPAASITVNVRDEVTQAPLSGIYVRLYRQGPSGWQTASSASTGAFFPGGVQFGNLAAGTYAFETLNGARTYAWCFWDRAFSWNTARQIVLADDTEFTAVVDLPAAGHIAGVVTNRAGVPLQGIYVYAFKTVGNSGQGLDTYTAADGSYDIGGLLAADDWTLFLEDQENQTYIYEYWSEARVRDDATPVAVSTGQTTTIDVQMRKAATISGVVTTRLGLPCQNVEAEVFARSASGGWTSVSGAGCDRDGAFTVGQLPPGRFSVEFWTIGHPDKKRYYPDTALRSEAKIFTLGYGESLDIHEIVWGDTDKPTPEAPDAETVAQGGTAKVVYRVRDPRPGGPTADVTIKVRTRGGKTVKTVVLPRRKVNRWLSGRFACGLPRGTYLFSVYAVDLGGNRQTRPAVNRLHVR